MSLEVSIAVQISEGDTRYVNVGRVESVLVDKFTGDEGRDALAQFDLIRARLSTLSAEVIQEAERQTTQLRGLLDSA